MITLLICLASLAALAQVFVSYCRSVLTSAKKVELSERVLEVALVISGSPSAEDFDRFFQLTRLCPEYDGDRSGIHAVAVYYDLLCLLGRVSSILTPKVTAWTLQERESCSHFAAVVLDRCISSSRNLFLEQASDGL
jgi:hypothetical protein